MNEPSCKVALQAQPRLSMTTARTVTSWNSEPNHPAKPLLNSWPSDIMWHNKCRWWLLVTRCWGNLLCSKKELTQLLNNSPPPSFYSCPPTPKICTPPAARMDHLLKRQPDHKTPSIRTLWRLPVSQNKTQSPLWPPRFCRSRSWPPCWAPPASPLSPLPLQQPSRIYQACPHLWDFTLAGPSAQKALSPDLYMAGSFSVFKLQLENDFPCPPV